MPYHINVGYESAPTSLHSENGTPANDLAGKYLQNSPPISDTEFDHPSASPSLLSQGPRIVASDDRYRQGWQDDGQVDSVHSMRNEPYTARTPWHPHEASIHRPVFQSEYGQRNLPIQPNFQPLAYPPTYPIYQAPIYYPTPYVAPTFTHPLHPQSYTAPTKMFSNPLPDSELPSGTSYKSPFPKLDGAEISGLNEKIEQPIYPKRPSRHNTGELAQHQGSGKRVRFTIPLRSRKPPILDEEKIVGLQGQQQDSPQREDSSSVWRSRHSLPNEIHEIVQSRWTREDDEGYEKVTLTIRNELEPEKNFKASRAMRWFHINSVAPVFRQFQDQVLRTPGLQGDEIALVMRLFDKVQRTSEQQYVHGKYLEPGTVTYGGEDSERGPDSRPKTATFICLPFFDVGSLGPSSNAKDNQSHPVRALLQTRYRLESTLNRDKTQVIRKLMSHGKKACVQLPQLWALVVNQDLLVTCAPCPSSVLCGDSINMLPFSQAKLDDAVWSIEFTNLTGGRLFIPIRRCRTWFGLIHQITKPEVEMYPWPVALIREQLLDGGPLFKLVDAADSEVATEESWPIMLHKKKEKGISLVLKEREPHIGDLKLSQTDGRSTHAQSEIAEDNYSTRSVKVVVDREKSKQGRSHQKRNEPIVFRAHEPPRSMSRPRYPVSSLDPFPIKDHTKSEVTMPIEEPQFSSRSTTINGTMDKRKQDLTTIIAQSKDIAAVSSNAQFMAQKPDNRRQPSTMRNGMAISESRFGLQPNTIAPNSRSYISSPGLDARRPPLTALADTGPLYDIPHYAAGPSLWASRSTSRRASFPYASFPMPHMALAPYNAPIHSQLGSPSYNTALAPRPLQLSYIPSRKRLAAAESFVKEKSNYPSRNDVEDTLTTSRRPMQRRNRLLLTSANSETGDGNEDRERCRQWKKQCIDLLARREMMRVFPEPPDWPCVIHDKYKESRALKACVCNLKKTYSLLGIEGNTLKRERKRWHPDRFSICPGDARAEMQRKSEELYKELEEVLPERQKKLVAFVQSDAKALNAPVPREALSVDDGAELRDRNGLLTNRHSNSTGLSNGPDVALELFRPPFEDSETQNLDTYDDKRNRPGSFTNGNPHSTRNRTDKSELVRSSTSNDLGGPVESKICGIWQYLDDSWTSESDFADTTEDSISEVSDNSQPSHKSPESLRPLRGRLASFRRPPQFVYDRWVMTGDGKAQRVPGTTNHDFPFSRNEEQSDWETISSQTPSSEQEKSPLLSPVRTSSQFDGPGTLIGRMLPGSPQQNGASSEGIGCPVISSEPLSLDLPEHQDLPAPPQPDAPRLADKEDGLQMSPPELHHTFPSEAQAPVPSLEPTSQGALPSDETRWTLPRMKTGWEGSKHQRSFVPLEPDPSALADLRSCSRTASHIEKIVSPHAIDTRQGLIDGNLDKIVFNSKAPVFDDANTAHIHDDHERSLHGPPLVPLPPDHPEIQTRSPSPLPLSRSGGRRHLQGQDRDAFARCLGVAPSWKPRESEESIVALDGLSEYVHDVVEVFEERPDEYTENRDDVIEVFEEWSDGHAGDRNNMVEVFEELSDEPTEEEGDWMVAETSSEGNIYRGIRDKRNGIPFRQATVEDVTDDEDVPSIRPRSSSSIGNGQHEWMVRNMAQLERQEKRRRKVPYARQHPYPNDGDRSLSSLPEENANARVSEARRSTNRHIHDNPDLAERNDPHIPIFLWSDGQVSMDFTDVTSHYPTAVRHGDSPHVVVPASPRLEEPLDSNEVVMEAILTECHDQLSTSGIAEERRIYINLRMRHERGVGRVAARFKKEVDKTSDLGAVDPDQVAENTKFLDCKETIFVLATQILKAFVPSSYDAEVLGKYWGAVYLLLTSTHDPIGLLTVLKFHLWAFWKLFQNIRLGVLDADLQQSSSYQIPKALPAAFQHLVMLFVASSVRLSPKESAQSQIHSEIFERACSNCEQYLLDGRNQLVLMVHTNDYREHAGYEAVDLSALLNLIIRNLLSISLVKSKFHITEMYSEYTAKMQSTVRQTASVRVYTDIEMLSEELEVIQATMDKQIATLWDLKSTLDYYDSTSVLGYRVLERMLARLHRQGEDFRELQHQAETARHRAAQAISLKAESNNKAILVFTVVTIIFLPLSFVTSYLGMNTVDVRNTSSGQGLFWATGLPITIASLAIALGAAYWEQLWAAFKAVRRKEKEKDE